MANVAAGPAEQVVACIGFFDGVHIGHQELLRVGTERARAAGRFSMAVTFDPHPQVVVSPPGKEGAKEGQEFRLLTTLEEKVYLMCSAGIDEVRVIPFTEELMMMEPYEFVRKYLVNDIGAGLVVVGFNFTFGFRASGKAQDLVRFGRELGFETVVVPPVRIGREVVSSTAIRKALAAGDVVRAMEFLGRPYSVGGTVVRGDGRGKSLGFPTANVKVDPHKMLPAPGVYACRVYRRGKAEDCEGGNRSGEGADSLCGRPAVANVGTCPTFDGTEMRVEVHIPRWSGNLYGEELRVEFLRRLREERKFASAEELRGQIARDVADVVESQK